LLARRPRLLSPLHRLRLIRPFTGTTGEELDCLSRHAAGRRTAIEIGTHMGVSAGVIASAIASDGRLYCVDPWIRRRFLENPSWVICNRHLRRLGVLQKIEYVRGFSKDVADMLPDFADFIFVDGDHLWSGLETDWHLVLNRLATNGVVCFHDTSVPVTEPERHPESVDFFHDIILASSSFVHAEECHSMNVLRRVSR